MPRIQGRKKSPYPLDPQLRKRVSSGQISGQRAKQTSQQRQTLKKAFGSDWRTQVFGKGGAEGITGPFAQSKVRSVRAKALSRAKQKLGSGLDQYDYLKKHGNSLTPPKAPSVLLGPSYGNWEPKAPKGSPRRSEEIANRLKEIRRQRRERETEHNPAGSGEKIV